MVRRTMLMAPATAATVGWQSSRLLRKWMILMGMLEGGFHDFDVTFVVASEA